MTPNNVNHFASAAVGVSKPRSGFHRPSKVLTSMNSGFLYPLYVDEVLPGDNMKIKLSSVFRMPTPPKVPVMDNAYLDVYAFFVPNRIIWNHWKEFMGENDNDYWTSSTTYQVPQITFNVSNRNPGVGVELHTKDLLGYLSCPPIQGSSGNVSVSALPVRAYCQICNDWFVDQNVQLPCNFSKGDSNVTYAFDSSDVQENAYISNAGKGGNLFRVNKYKDYFTSCLPSAQRGNPVLLPLGDLAPVYARAENINLTGTNYHALQFSPNPLDGFPSGYSFGAVHKLGHMVAGSDVSQLVMDTASGTTPSGGYTLTPSNLWADLSEATASTVNQLRLAFQTQKYLETLARGGARYIEQLYAQFGVMSSDKTLQRSQYLGGKRFPITMTEVPQTSATVSGQTPQANVAAYQHSGFVDEYICNEFFEEHGFLLVVGCIRCDNSYSQGAERFWFRKDRLDFYSPVFANIGEQAVLNQEIYLSGTVTDEQAFGYQEAWAEYRYKPNKLTGVFYNRALMSNVFSVWNYSQLFNSKPVLSYRFLQHGNSQVDQTMVQSGVQFLVDLYFDNYSVRRMPMYSVPGLIDHA